MKRIFIIIISTIICLLLVGKFLDYRYKKFWDPVFKKMDVVFKDTSRYDGIYLGDSRVHFGINPYYTDSILGLKTYNLGMGGASINEIYFLANAYLDKHPAPKFAIVSIGYADILQSYRYFENPCYYFFYLDNKLNNDALAEQHYHTSLFRVLPILKYTAFDDFNKITISKNLNGETLLKPEGTTYNGFINNSTAFFNTAQQALAMRVDTASQKGIDKLELLIQLLKKNNCLPILVYPPVLDYSLINENKVFVKIDSAIAKLGATYSTPILHYDTDSSFVHDLFSDQWHVNIPGSVVYSKKIGFAIQKIIAGE